MNYKTLLGAVGVIAILMLVAYSTVPAYLDKQASTSVTTETPLPTQPVLAVADQIDTITPSPETPTIASGTPTTPPPTPTTPIPSPTPQPTPTPELLVAEFTLADVSTHASESSCWTIIHTSVYDITPYLSKHPGGVKNIIKICGTDGTKLFTDQHGGQSRPENTLAEFFIGVLVK